MGGHCGRRGQKCSASDRKGRESTSGLQVEDLKVSVTQSQSALVLDVSGTDCSCTFLDLKMDDVIAVMLFRIGFRSPTRNRKLRGTTERFHGMDGLPRRHARNNACLRQIGAYSQTCTT